VFPDYNEASPIPGFKELFVFGNLILFLVVLLVYTVHAPEGSGTLDVWSRLSLNLVFVFAFGLTLRMLFGRLSRRIEAGRLFSPSLAYHRLLFYASILAAIQFSLAVYVFELKNLFVSLPWVGRWETGRNLLGLGWFTLLMVLVWSESYPVYRRIQASRLARRRYVLGQLRFNLPVVLPYLLLTLLGDLKNLLPPDGIRAWLDSSTGETVSLFVYLVGLSVFFPLIIRPVWGLVPLPPGERRDYILAFMNRHGFRCREVMNWPLYEGEGLTAGVMGPVARWRFLLVTEGLLRVLDDEELTAVLAHELGHVKKRHLWLYLGFVLAMIVLTSYLAGAWTLAVLYFGWPLEWLGAAPAGGSDQVSTLAVTALYGLFVVGYIRFIFGAYMRHFERQADLYAFRLTGTVDGLIRSLEKIARLSGQSRNVPSWHHFSVAQRVDFLERCRRDPGLADRHDRQVRFMLAGYVLAVLAILAGGWALATHQSVEKRLVARAITLLEQEAQTAPPDAERFRQLGDLYYYSDHLPEAARAFEKALALGPADPELLNSLAWTLAIMPQSTSEDRARALALAREAAAVKPAAHILDTLAEALYVNGHVMEALEVIDQALARLGPEEDSNHYLKQKAKFRGQRTEL
jgi:Zn-dependent protease with chaperone function